MNAGVLVFLLLIILSFMGMPIFIALGIGTTAALALGGFPLEVIPQKVFTGINSTSLLAIPFFILAGNIMSQGITDKLINVSNAMIGWVKGSLAVVTVLGSAFFGAISGSAVATVSAIGGITIPAMKEEKYPAPFAAAIASMSSILGPMIPPSISLIVYASITGVSVKKLFLATVIPGVLLAIILMIYCLLFGKKHDLPAHPRLKSKEIRHTIADGIWALLMPIIILGGIFGGIFTATEAAAVSVIYAAVINFFVYKKMKLKALLQMIINSSVASATIMILVGLSTASSYVVVASKLPQLVLQFMNDVAGSRFMILLIVNIILLILGMLMEGNSIITMMTPLLLTTINAYNVDLIHFGIIMSYGVCIGVMTPPVGLSLLLGCQIADTRIGETMPYAFMQLLLGILLLLAVTYIPQLSIWLPSFAG
ncbi:MAG: TRAP transporter large permease [Clostridiaceae bacterium]|jgi:C4-dicarboxylate transporter DctM subunit|nr:TRAP transporter large permease [Clostridiaceae bacterium]